MGMLCSTVAADFRLRIVPFRTSLSDENRACSARFVCVM